MSCNNVDDDMKYATSDLATVGALEEFIKRFAEPYTRSNERRQGRGLYIAGDY
jgi:hypothetical protein